MIHFPHLLTAVLLSMEQKIYLATTGILGMQMQVAPIHRP